MACTPHYGRPAAGAALGGGAAVADILAGGSVTPVRPLLCIHGGVLPEAHWSVESVQVATQRQLAGIVRQGSPLQPSDVERATARALELLRPAI